MGGDAIVVSRRGYGILNIKGAIDTWRLRRAMTKVVDRQIDGWITTEHRREIDTSGLKSSDLVNSRVVESAPEQLASDAAMRQQSGVFYKSSEADQPWGGEYVSDLESAPMPTPEDDRTLDQNGKNPLRNSVAISGHDAALASLEEAENIQIEQWITEKEYGMTREENHLTLGSMQNQNFTYQSAHQVVQTSSHVMERGLEQVNDTAVDKIRQLLLRQSFSWKREEAMQFQDTQPKPRHKYLDPKRTIRKYMTAPSGMISRFAYRKSRSIVTQRGLPVRFLMIGDVSGSMGRYMGVVLYLLSSLRSLAVVDSYIFSDEVTHASPILTGESFREQYMKLKEQAVSWEYGTRLGTALQNMIHHASLTEETIVVLFTDGGFSLEDTEWADTVTGLTELVRKVHSFYVATPNKNLFQDGSDCAMQLWDVETDLYSGRDKNDPITQKIARFGLLSRYSQEMIFCQTPGDVVLLFKRLIHHSLRV